MLIFDYSLPLSVDSTHDHLKNVVRCSLTLPYQPLCAERNNSELSEHQQKAMVELHESSLLV